MNNLNVKPFHKKNLTRHKDNVGRVYAVSAKIDNSKIDLFLTSVDRIKTEQLCIAFLNEHSPKCLNHDHYRVKRAKGI